MNARHSLPHADIPFASRHGELLVGGIPVGQLALRVGQTPFYAYDRAAIAARVSQVKALLPACSIHYAVKANPMGALVDFMAHHVDGFDIASAGELRLALNAGMAPSRISFAGPGKRPHELEQAIAAGVLVNVESASELKMLASLAKAQGRAARVALRINPDFELKAAGLRMGGGAKPFGIDAEDALEVARSADAWARIEGLHIFSGSQNLDAQLLAEASQKAAALATQLAHALPMELRSLNIGGGFGIPYFPGERRLDLETLAPQLNGIAAGLKSEFVNLEVRIELGRYLVGEAGVYITRVIDRKVSRGSIFLVVDGGLHHHLAASGNFGQVLRKNFPVTIANRMGSSEWEVASVVGPLCTPLDILADRMELAAAQIGDLVAVFQSGAYGLSASPTAFLSHPAPVEVLV